MPPDEVSIITFRIETMEKQIADVASLISSVDRKVDTLLDRLGDLNTEMALLKQAQDQLQREQDRVELLVERHATEINGLKVSLAERIGPGAVAGAIVAAAILALQFLF